MTTGWVWRAHSSTKALSAFAEVGFFRLAIFGQAIPEHPVTLQKKLRASACGCAAVCFPVIANQYITFVLANADVRHCVGKPQMSFKQQVSLELKRQYYYQTTL